MSLRDHFVAVKSIAEIRGVIASRDLGLRSQLAKKYDEILAKEYGPPSKLDEDGVAELDRRRSVIHATLDQVLMCDNPPETEHGDWGGLFDVIAGVKGLTVRDRLPLQTYKHLHTWCPYQEHVQTQIPDHISELLGMIEEGRPLRGTTMKHDWEMYAWLDRAEIADMLRALLAVQFGEDDGSGLLDFHTDLLTSLTWLSKKKLDMLLIVS